MSAKANINELFELAIAAEKAVEELYRGLEAKFVHHQEVANFWRKYAAEEAGHARWLQHLQALLDPEQLAAPADLAMLEDARRVLRFPVQDALEEIENLQDAYQLVNELENAETNAIFEFLINNFSADEKTQAFLRAQLKDHIARLMTESPAQFKDVVSRQAIKVLE